MKARAVVFDFDGLLVETEGPAYQAWTEIYRYHGHELPRDENAARCARHSERQAG